MDQVDKTPDNDATLMSDGFDSTTLTGWTSYVGGENEQVPTWHSESGVLVQPVEDGLIRAILAGDSSWADYSVAARIRIDSANPESRAGLVFRDDGRGFYVLRFTRSSGKAQLMYHSRSPFGWHELATVPVAVSCDGGRWVAVKAEARGPFVRCFVDDTQYIDLADSRSRSGRAGFYACEAKVAYDDFTVRRKAAMPVPPSWVQNPPYAPALSFWFRETFTDHVAHNWELPDGWSLSGAFCIRADTAARPTARLSGAPFSDGVVSVKVRVLDGSLDEFHEMVKAVMGGKPPPDPAAATPGGEPNLMNQGRAGIILRGRGRSYYALILERATPRLVLVRRDEDAKQEEVLASVEFKSPPEDRWYTLAVQCKGSSMIGSIDQIPCIALSDNRHSVGYLGLFADGGPAVFTDLLAASGR